MKTTITCVVAIFLTISGTYIYSQDAPAASPAKDDANTVVGNDDATATKPPEPAVYCTLLCCDKLVTDLHLTKDQRDELAKLEDQLKSSVLNGGVRSHQHGGLATGRARTLVKMTEARLTFVGGKVKDVLTAKQDQAFNEFYSSGKLRPLEVAASEVHDPNHGTKGKSFGRIALVPHYGDSAGNGRSNSATQGVMHGTHADGSYYRESSSPGSGSTAAHATKQNPSSNDDVGTLLANLKKAGHEPVALTFALQPIERRIPREPNPAMAEALENVLLENSSPDLRVSAAKSLENWGRPESVPALQKAARSSDHRVADAAQNAIKALTNNATAGSDSASAVVEKPAQGASPAKHATSSAVRSSARPASQADRDAALADIQSGDATKCKFAILRIGGKKPVQPDAEMAKAIEQVLRDDAIPHVRSMAARALQNWGTADSIPALQKALDDPDKSVQTQSKKAIDMISSQQ